ncbi:RidA family protein [Euzebya tangerina]|uniref:RidA family protein n=1 Tax=Euzebya tangerina TaxID=591198 RepID=UPI000E318051|nr:Rid family hydrolase [Euzebya tangerina]
MTSTFINPSDLHDPTPFGYSHTAAVAADARLVFVAGQYGSGPDGAATSPEFGEQVEQAFANLGVALAAHGLEFRDVVQLRTYVVGLDFERLGAVSAVVGGHWPADLPTQTVIGVAGLALPDILFEVEAVAARTEE